MSFQILSSLGTIPQGLQHPPSTIQDPIKQRAIEPKHINKGTSPNPNPPFCIFFVFSVFAS